MPLCRIIGGEAMSQAQGGAKKPSDPPSPAMAGADEKPGDSAATGSSTRRAHERRNFDRLVLVYELDDGGIPGPEWQCRAVDISRGGIGLRSRRMVHAGRKLFIRFPAGHGVPEKLLFGVVKQSRYQEGEGFVIGVKFEEEPHSWAIAKWAASHGVAELLRGVKPDAA